MCFVWIWEQTAIISLYSINWSVFITEAECLLRGTKWVFKSDRHSFVLKGLNAQSDNVSSIWQLRWHILISRWRQTNLQGVTGCRYFRLCHMVRSIKIALGCRNSITVLWRTCVKFTKLQNLISFFPSFFYPPSFSYYTLSVVHFIPSLSSFLHLRSVPLFELPPPIFCVPPPLFIFTACVFQP